MATKSKDSRLAQRAYWENRLDQRLTVLAEKGLDPVKIAKDAAVKKIRSELRKTEARLQVIENREKKVEEMAKAKADKEASPKKDKKGKKTDTGVDPKESRRQQKKKQKQEAKEAKSKSEEA